MECATFGDGIRVNSVHPGIIDTPIWGKIPTGAADSGQNAPIDPEERAKMATPLGRAGHAEEIAQGVLYLASDASRYVTGTELVIDGGMNAGGVARGGASSTSDKLLCDRPPKHFISELEDKNLANPGSIRFAE